MGHSAVRIDSKYPCRVPPAVSRGQSHGTGREGWASCLLPLSPQQDGFKLETQGLPSRTQAQDVRIEPPSSEDRPLLLPHLCGSNKGSLTNFTHPSRAPSHPPSSVRWPPNNIGGAACLLPPSRALSHALPQTSVRKRIPGLHSPPARGGRSRLQPSSQSLQLQN